MCNNFVHKSCIFGVNLCYIRTFGRYERGVMSTSNRCSWYVV